LNDFLASTRNSRNCEKTCSAKVPRSALAQALTTALQVMASSPSRRTSEEQKGEKLTEDLKIFHQFCEENVRSVCKLM